MNSRTSITRRRAGFTLMEVMMVTLVVAITAVVLIPGSSGQDPVSIQAASANLSGDLEYAQAASVADPADPVVVWFDAPSNRYWLAKASTPTEPIDRPGAPAGTKFDVRLNEMAGNSRLDLTVEGVGSYVRFDAMGRLQQTSDIVVTLSNDAGRIDMFIDAESGSVSAMADASTSAVVTPGVFVDPALVLRPEDESPTEVPDPAAPAAPTATASADLLQAAASRTVDTLIASGGTNATSSGTATIGGVLVGVTSTTRATTTAVAGTTTGTVAATTSAATTTTTAATTATTGAVATTTTAATTTTTTAVSTTTSAVSTVTGGLLGSGSSGSGSSGSGGSGSGTSSTKGGK